MFSEKYQLVGRLLKDGEEPTDYTDTEEETTASDKSKAEWFLCWINGHLLSDPPSMKYGNHCSPVLHIPSHVLSDKLKLQACFLMTLLFNFVWLSETVIVWLWPIVGVMLSDMFSLCEIVVHVGLARFCSQWTVTILLHLCIAFVLVKWKRTVICD